MGEVTASSQVIWDRLGSMLSVCAIVVIRLAASLTEARLKKSGWI